MAMSVKLIFVIYVCVCAMSDAIYRRISVEFSIAVMLAGVPISILTGRPVIELVKAVLPGLIILFVSIVSRGGIGIGDALFTMVCGMFISWSCVTVSLITAWCLCAMTGLVLIAMNMCGSRFAERMTGSGLPFISIMAVPLLYAVLVR